MTCYAFVRESFLSKCFRIVSSAASSVKGQVHIRYPFLVGLPVWNQHSTYSIPQSTAKLTACVCVYPVVVELFNIDMRGRSDKIETFRACLSCLT